MTDSAMSSSRNDPWGAFTDRLAQTLDGFLDGQFLILMISPVAAGAEGVMPYVQVLRDEDRFITEVSSNDYLEPDQQIDIDQEHLLLSEGWDRPQLAAGNWGMTTLTAEESASRMVHALREVFYVVHPSLLELGGTGDQVDDEREVDVSLLSNATEPLPNSDPDVGLEQTPAVIVSDPADLPRFVKAALQAGFSPEIHANADGVIPLRAEDVLILVEAPPDRYPWAHVVGLLAEKVDDSADLIEYINDMNAVLPGLRLIKEGSRVLGRIDVLGNPFVPMHMVEAVNHVAVAVQDIRPYFLELFGGRNFYGSRSDSAGGSDASDEGTGNEWTGGYL